MTEHRIESIRKNSIAQSCGICPGDVLLKINGEEIEDIFDYQYQCENTSVDISVRKTDGSVMSYHMDKDEDDDIGLVFEAGIMDEYRRCSNKCIFCFIDQNPPCMRETIYFKDDDARLSFLQGNYITLTNMSDHDIDRVIKYRLMPVNISFHTMNPELRCTMLNNRFAGDALKKADRLFEAGITMNGQIVLCKGVNDGKELEYSLKKLYEYVPVLESLSVVPVGLSDHREGLYPLKPFTPEDALEVISVIDRWQKKAYAEHGTHFVHASDEWYINAGVELPAEETYDGYLQIENGVGMMRSVLTEFYDGLDIVKEGGDIYQYCESDPIRDDDTGGTGSGVLQKIKGLFASHPKARAVSAERITVITGRLAVRYIRQMAESVTAAFPEKSINVMPITNRFFGEKITVTGLLTGQDIIEQCKEYVASGGELGDRLLINENTLRSGTDVLLDDVTVGDIESALQVKVDIVKSSGYDALKCMLYAH